REPIQADASGGKKTVSMIRRTVSLCRGPERVAAALLVPMLVYFAFRFIAVPGGQVIESKASGDLWDVPRLIAYYSLQLGMVFPQVVSPPLDWAPSRLLSALLLGAGAVLCGWVFCRWGKRSTPLLLGVFWIVVGIGPSTLVLIQGTDSYVISERYLYLPSVGFALCVGWAWTLVAGRSIRIRGIAATAVVLLGVAGVTQAIAYGMHWRSEELLWSHVAQRVPTQVRAWNNLAVEYGRQGDGTARLHAARRAAELDPESSKMLFNHAKAAREIGKLEEALGAAKQAIKFAPDADWAWIEKGLIEIALGQPDAANKSMRKAIRLNPQNEMPYINLSVLQNAPEERLALLRRAIELNPMNSMAFNNLGLLYADVGKWQLAEDCLKRAIELQPTSELAQRNLAMLKEKRRAAEN
ncbi:MAG: tetratricopeptide repeat protein, partial [Planctomycetota bacterium]